MDLGDFMCCEIFRQNLSFFYEILQIAEKVTKNGTFETCSNRTCNYKKQLEAPVSETTEE